MVAVAAVDDQTPAGRYDFGPLDGQRGTRVAVELSLPNDSAYRILDLDPARSVVTHAHDTTGRDLLGPVPAPPAPRAPSSPSLSAAAPALPPPPATAGLFGTPSADARHLLVELGVPRPPAPGAQVVTLAARVQVRLARGLQATPHPGIVLQPGPLTLAAIATPSTTIFATNSAAPSVVPPVAPVTTPLTARIVAVTQEDWGRGVFTQIAFRFTGPAAPRVSGLRLLDASGDPLGGTVRAMARYRSRSDLTFALPADRNDRRTPVTLELTLWDELITVPVEIRVTAPLGLGPGGDRER